MLDAPSQENQERGPVHRFSFGIGINILIIAVVILVLLMTPGKEGNDGHGPTAFQGTPINNSTHALEVANAQLAQMAVGNIKTLVVGEDYFATLVRDHEMGDVEYWQLSDMEIMVGIAKSTGEIILYMDTEGWYEGDLTQRAIEAQANRIASQFAPLPPDRSEIQSQFRPLLSETVYTDDGNETTTMECWVVQYDRIQDGIVTDDHIVLILYKNGYLASYRKVWSTDLEGPTTDYSVTEGQARATALDHAGEGSTVTSVTKKIIKPNNFFSGENDTKYYDTVSVYEIWVRDAEDCLRIYHVDGNKNVIVGGDYCYKYFEQ